MEQWHSSPTTKSSTQSFLQQVRQHCGDPSLKSKKSVVVDEEFDAVPEHSNIVRTEMNEIAEDPQSEHKNHQGKHASCTSVHSTQQDIARYGSFFPDAIGTCMTKHRRFQEGKVEADAKKTRRGR